MERLDALVAGIGVLVVATALAGVVVSGPGPEGGGRAFRIGFPEQRIPLPAQQGSFSGDGTRDVPVQVTTPNATRVAFTVRVTGAGPRAAPDSVEVTLAGPDGRRESQQATLPGPGASADVTLAFERPVGRAPATQDVRGASEAQALAGVAGQAHRNGTGTWTVTVTVRGGLPVHNEAHTIVVESAVVAYRAVVQPEPVNPR